MKVKILCSLLVCILACVLAFSVSCTKRENLSEGNDEGVNATNVEESAVEDACPYALMHDGVMYYYTGETIFEDVGYTEEDVLGKVTATIPENRMPTEDGMANIPIEGSIYIKHQASDSLLVLIDKEWIIFETRD